MTTLASTSSFRYVLYSFITVRSILGCGLPDLLTFVDCFFTLLRIHDELRDYIRLRYLASSELQDYELACL